MVAKYWVKAVDLTDLSSPYSNMRFTTVVPLIAKAIADVGFLPEIYDLHPAQPNPFNPSTTLRYDLPQASRVQLTIYDVMGREVNSHAALEEAGYRSVTWQGRDRAGRALPSGIYIYRLLAIPAEGGKPFIATRKMLLLK